MGIRMSGLASGLDTESIIKELMAAQRTKLTKTEAKQTKLTWTQEKWKTLNSKLLDFYSKEMNALKTQGRYQSKKVASSNESKASATATISAATGSHTLEIEKLASSQYITGGKITKPDGGKVLGTTKLTDLGIANNSSFTISGGRDTEGNVITKVFTVTADSTMSDFTKACSGAGLNANFDESQGRLFISSKASGLDHKFTITSSEGGYRSAIDDIRRQAGYFQYSNDTDADIAAKAAIDEAIGKIGAAGSTRLDAIIAAIDSGTEGSLPDPEDQELAGYIKDFQLSGQQQGEIAAEKLKTSAIRDTLAEEYFADETKAAMLADPETSGLVEGTEEYIAAYAIKLKGIKESTTADALETEVDTRFAADQANYDAQIQSAGDAGRDQAKAELRASMATLTAGDSSVIGGIGLAEITGDPVTAADPTQMSVTAVSDAKVILDGAVMSSGSNNFTVNGIKLDLKEETQAGEVINLTVQNDTEAVYTMVKGFVKKYNEILKDLNEMYYAESSRGFEPLTTEEKDGLTDEEQKDWEKKIKDSLLRRDNTLSSIASAMKNTMSAAVKVGDKSYSLGDTLGIGTMAYDYTEKGLLHITGDEDEVKLADKDNKLKLALDSDPELVMNILTQVGSKLYSEYDNKMKKTSLSSAMTFYNDVEMKNTQADYKKKLKEMERKLSEQEDRYYKQFTAMEKAMNMLQNQGNSLASMMGMGGQ